MRKIFDQIDREKSENEFNRTAILDRTSQYYHTL